MTTKKKIEIVIPLMLETQVTKTVEFPFYFHCKRENTFNAINFNEEMKLFPFKHYEVKLSNDASEGKIWMMPLNDKEVAGILAKIDSGAYVETSRDSFIDAVKIAISTYTNVLNEI